MSKYGIRNYGPPRQIPCGKGTVTLLSDGVIETDDPELVKIAGAMEAIHVTTHPDGKGARPKPPVEPLVEPPSGSATEEAKPLDEMTVAELKVMAEEAGIELPTRIRKAELVELLLSAN